MHNLRQFYYANKKQIWIAAFIIFFLFAIIKFFDNRAFSNSGSKDKLIQTINNTSASTQLSEITGKEISDKQYSTQTEVIKDFIEACNKKDIEKAYSLLSEDCKEEVYSSIDKFEAGYYKSIFNNIEKTYSMNNWYDSTYSVKFKNDMLATGKNNNDEALTDYITVVEENDENKLNINNYIGKTIVNKKAFRKNITITVEDKKTYKEYEYYDVVIENQSESNIMIDPLLSTETIYIEDKNGVKYTSYSHELIENTMIVQSNHTRNLKIKFSNQYSTNRKIESMVFENLILNYDEYLKSENKEDYSDYFKFGISL